MRPLRITVFSLLLSRFGEWYQLEQGTCTNRRGGRGMGSSGRTSKIMDANRDLDAVTNSRASAMSHVLKRKLVAIHRPRRFIR